MAFANRLRLAVVSPRERARDGEQALKGAAEQFDTDARRIDPRSERR
jgi:hypothetical protein